MSIQYKLFEEAFASEPGGGRGLTPIDLCRCPVPLSGMVCGTKTSPSCAAPACPATGPGECTPAYSGGYAGVANSIETAWDGLTQRGDGYITSIQQNLEQVTTHSIEVDLGGMKQVCGLQLVWDASDRYAHVWRVSSTTGSGSYTLLAEAGRSGSGKEVISGDPAWETIWGGQVGQNNYGLKCTAARRVRLEMEDSESDLFFELIELKVLTGMEDTCSCRHGGVCRDDLSCTCPAVAFPTCTKVDCGWGGPTCSLAACVTDVTCANTGLCSGPNTCTCRVGWHGTSGAAQCVTPRCGDGGVTNSVQGGGETCDDGNLINGDGCSATCQAEEVPPNRVPTPESPSETLYIPRDEICDAHYIGVESCAASMTNPSKQNVANAIMADCAGTMGCIVYEDQIVEMWNVCTLDGAEVPGRTWGDCGNNRAREEVKYSIATGPCPALCYNGAQCHPTLPQCMCKPGWEGSDCSVSMCEHGCDHGGKCIGKNDCGACGDGWTGDYCGTAEGFLAGVTLVFGGIVTVLLGCSIILTCCRITWVPIKARGVTTLIGKFIGGMVWITTACCSIWGEAYGYDVRFGDHVPVNRGTCMVSANQEYKTLDPAWPRAADDSCVDTISCYRGETLVKDCAGNPEDWQLWYPLVFGFGLWLASNLAYLRSMAQIHIFHTVPLAFIALLLFLLGPWVVASWIGSPIAALILGVVFLLYSAMIYSELWPIRTDFLDVKHHAWGCICGIVNVLVQIWAVNGGRIGRRIDWDLEWDHESVTPAGLAVANAFATVCIVTVHFIATAGHLLYLALTRANDPEVLEEYYDEYNPDDKEHFAAQMHTFDHQVRTHAHHIDDHSLHGRIARRRFKNEPSVMEEERQTRMVPFFGPISWVLCPFTLGLVYFCPVDKHEVYVSDGFPVKPLCHHKAKRAARDSYHHAAHNTAVGQHIHKHAYHRHQFGTRKKLKSETLSSMGRDTSEHAHKYPTIVHENMPPGGWWSAEDGFRNGGSTIGTEDRANTLANKPGGWRAQAAERAEETREEAIAAMPDADRARGGAHGLPPVQHPLQGQQGRLPPLAPPGAIGGHHHHHHQDADGQPVHHHHHQQYGAGP